MQRGRIAKPSRRRRSSPALRAIIFSGLCVAALHWGPAFSVRGSWDGSLADVRRFPDGLKTDVGGGLTFDQKPAVITVDDGGANLQWSEGPLSFRVNDGRVWQANLTKRDMKFRARGTGSEGISWEASKRRVVKGVGDITVDMNSDQDVGVVVEPSLPDIAGVHLRGLASWDGHGIHGRLQAQRQLSKAMDVSYRVENAEGDYDLANLSHAARLVGRLGDGTLVLDGARHRQVNDYNVTISQDLGKLWKGAGGVTVGADKDGIYGALAARRNLPGGMIAGYEAVGRSSMDMEDPSFIHAGKLSNGLGSVKLVQSNGEMPRALLHSDIRRGANRFQGALGYSPKDEEPSFNVTVSRDLADALSKLDAAGTLQVGVDGPSIDGLYGSVSARRQLGNGFGWQYRSAGRIDHNEHSLKLANDLGYAELLKVGDEQPRLRLGYEFEA